MNISKMKRSTQIAILAGAGSATEEKTVSGTTPLTLSDSVAGSIHSIAVKGHSEVVDGDIKSIGDDGFTITTTDDATNISAATITTGLPLRSVSDSIYDTMDNEKVTKKCGKVKGSDLTWERYLFSGTYVFYATVNDAIPKISTCLSNTYTINNTVSSISQLADKECTMRMSNNVLYVRDDTYTDVQTFTTAIADVEFVYVLDTPTETPLTSAEKSALASLRTYDHTTYIDATDNPSITVKYMGKKTATRTAPKKRTRRKKA